MKSTSQPKSIKGGFYKTQGNNEENHENPTSEEAEEK
jgi:hypothetical protein